MEDKQFETIIKNLNELIIECNDICVHDKEELRDLTLREVEDRLIKSRKLYGKMDKILKNELYHVIGMGDLTPEQTKLFMLRIKMVCMFRPYLKPLSCSVINISKIPEDTEYKCETLGVDLALKIK